MSKKKLNSTQRRSGLGRELLRAMSDSKRGQRSKSRTESGRSRAGSGKEIVTVVAPDSDDSFSDDMNILDDIDEEGNEKKIRKKNLPPKKKTNVDLNKLRVLKKPPSIPPPPLSSTPAPPRRPRSKSRRGSVTTYTKKEVVTYSQSALNETQVRPSANLFAIASRRHLNINNEQKGEVMSIPYSHSLPVKNHTPKVVKDDSSIVNFRRYTTSADVGALQEEHERQLSDNSLYKKFVQQRKARGRDFANVVATRLSFGIVQSLRLHRLETAKKDAKADVERASFLSSSSGNKKTRYERMKHIPLGSDINFSETKKHKFKTSDCTITVKDYFPSTFDAIRSIYEIRFKTFVDSLSVLDGGSEGEGKSKQLFFFTQNKKYVIKTVKKHELQLMKDLIEKYYYHIAANPDTLLCRFFGLYKVRLSSGLFNMSSVEYTVIVMNNCMRVPPVFSKPCQIYDLKGSSYGRITNWKDFKQGMVGKEHNFKEKALRENKINGPSSICIDDKQAAKLMRQLDVDAFWLRSNNIMDYSLLLAVYRIPRGLGDLTTIDLNVTNDTDGTYLAWWQRWYGGVRGNTSKEADNYLYTFGVIDILQSYNWKKAAETYARAGHNDDYTDCEVSAIPSNDYSLRFLRYIRSKLS
jgi:hypothetical protein